MFHGAARVRIEVSAALVTCLKTALRPLQGGLFGSPNESPSSGELTNRRGVHRVLLAETGAHKSLPKYIEKVVYQRLSLT